MVFLGRDRSPDRRHSVCHRVWHPPRSRPLRREHEVGRIVGRKIGTGGLLLEEVRIAPITVLDRLEGMLLV